MLASPTHSPMVPPEDAALFSPEALEAAVWDVAERTATNRSSMLRDLEEGRETEIEFINGWVMRMGRERGVETPFNERMWEGVKTKSSLSRTAMR